MEGLTWDSADTKVYWAWGKTWTNDLQMGVTSEGKDWSGRSEGCVIKYIQLVSFAWQHEGKTFVNFDEMRPIPPVTQPLPKLPMLNIMDALLA